MIYDTLDHLEAYRGVHPGVMRGLELLRDTDFSQWEDGRHEIDGERLFILLQSYETKLQNDTPEAHRKYIDIQYLLSGQEQIGVTDAARLREIRRDEAADFVGFEGPVECWAPMRPGDLLIVFPEDVHMVKVQYQGPSHVEKAVFKIKA